MTPYEFEQALDRWGADLDRWPAAAAVRARACLADSPRARRALAAARTVQAHLAAWHDHAAPADLAGRIGAAVRSRGAVDSAGVTPPDSLERLLGWLVARRWRPAMLGLLLLAGGFLIGVRSGPPMDARLADQVVGLAFDDLYAELDDAQ